MRIREAGCVGYISYLQRLAGLGIYPQAPGAILQDDGRAGLVISDGSKNAQPPREIEPMNAGEDFVHGRERQGPWIGIGALKNLDIRQRPDSDFDSGLLHFAVECSAGRAGHLDLRVHQVFHRGFIAAVHFKEDVTAIHEQLQAAGGDRRSVHQIGGAHHPAYSH